VVVDDFYDYFLWLGQVLRSAVVAMETFFSAELDGYFDAIYAKFPESRKRQTSRKLKLC
jgi:hypothetical protein